MSPASSCVCDAFWARRVLGAPLNSIKHMFWYKCIEDVA